MNKMVAMVGAPSSIGIRPYNDGRSHRLDLALNALREQRLVARLGAVDLGDVLPPAYRDFARPPGKVRNEEGVAQYSRAMAPAIRVAIADGSFVIASGGDCSIVLGCLLGVQRAASSRVGLVYVDAHADFATPESSRTGSAASMCLALAVGRGNTPLARLRGSEPLVRGEDVVLVGRRDDADALWYGHDALREMQLLDIPHAEIRKRGAAKIARAVLDHVTRPAVDGFWIHVDADVLDPSVLPAVDSPEPGGLSLDELAEVLTPLVHHPQALGLELTIYDPALDPDAVSAAHLASLLERVLAASLA